MSEQNLKKALVFWDVLMFGVGGMVGQAVGLSGFLALVGYFFLLEFVLIQQHTIKLFSFYID